jgi:hypothetical protein
VEKLLVAEGEISHVAGPLIAASSLLLLLNSSGQRMGLEVGFDRFENLDLVFRINLQGSEIYVLVLFKIRKGEGRVYYINHMRGKT